ncbi:prepilin-type N-terminal cleavage/methylation domain-containing protein [Methylomagnum sp.]
MNSGRRFRAANGGFTLIEVLIGATLLAVMMTLLMGSLRIGAQSWEMGEERMAKASRMFIVENFLRSHIESLLPVAATLKNGVMEPAFQGRQDTLSYVAPLPEQVKLGGLYRFDLYISKGEKKDLRMAILPYNTLPDKVDTTEPLDDLALLENIEELKLAYLPRPNPGGGLNPLQGQNQDIKWSDEWRENQMPALIRIDIKPAGEDAWPTLLIAPKTLMLR